MNTILIGSTGFVGSNLQTQMKFDALLSSRNIAEFKGVQVDLAIVAAGDARKWYANQHPTLDQQHIQQVINDICSININRVVHFSTVDVYASKAGDEDELARQISSDAYGGNRHRMERALVDRFKNVTTIRLPGLYGPGLKKNLIYDLSQGRDLNGFNPNSAFQWFDLLDLSKILEFVDRTGIQDLNVCAEPLTVSELLTALGLQKTLSSTAAQLIRYDIRTKHTNAYGKSGNYLYSKDESIAGIKRFLQAAKQRTQ